MTTTPPPTAPPRVIRTDRRGTRYVHGVYGNQYTITDLASVDHHLGQLIGSRGTDHPDVDVLLDARNELTQEAP